MLAYIIGIKVHLRFKVHTDGVVPDKMVTTLAKPANSTQMDAINVFDWGYLDYK